MITNVPSKEEYDDDDDDDGYVHTIAILIKMQIAMKGFKPLKIKIKTSKAKYIGN
jgi:hypothetical protein